jgi:hypothetical protein
MCAADAPKSLTDDEVYAYILQLNGIIDDSAVVNAQTLARVHMSNSDGFIIFSRQK